MQYQVSRSGQVYGPYTLEDLKRYIASGHILPTDLVRSDENADWVPVSQVVSSVAGEAPLPPDAPLAPPAAYGQAMPPSGAAIYPDPPNLHWGLVLLFGILTCGVFTIVYDIVQASWMKRVQPNTKALLYYIIAAVCWFLNLTSSATHMAHIHGGTTYSRGGTGSIFGLAYFIMLIVARFAMRSSMEEHFNGPEPIGLRLSGVMTFFFGSLYFQYHFSRINELKRAYAFRGGR